MNGTIRCRDEKSFKRKAPKLLFHSSSHSLFQLFHPSQIQMAPPSPEHLQEVGNALLVYTTCLACEWRRPLEFRRRSCFSDLLLIIFFSSFMTLAILWWDVLSTFPREIKLVWKPLFEKGMPSPSLGSLTVALFFVCRWICVVSIVHEREIIPNRVCRVRAVPTTDRSFPSFQVQFIVIVWSIWRVWTPSACENFYLFDSVVSAVVVASASAIMAIRVSALFGRRRALEVPLLLCWMVLAAVVLWSSTFVEPVP